MAAAAKNKPSGKVIRCWFLVLYVLAIVCWLAAMFLQVYPDLLTYGTAPSAGFYKRHEEHDYNYYQGLSGQVIQTQCKVVEIQYRPEAIECERNHVGEWSEHGRFRKYTVMGMLRRLSVDMRVKNITDIKEYLTSLDVDEAKTYLEYSTIGLVVHEYTDDNSSADEQQHSHTDHLPRMQEEMPPPPDRGPQDGPFFPCGIVGVEYMDEDGNSTIGIFHQNVDQEDNFPQCAFDSCNENYTHNALHLQTRYEPLKTNTTQGKNITCYYYTDRPEVAFMEKPIPIKVHGIIRCVVLSLLGCSLFFLVLAIIPTMNGTLRNCLAQIRRRKCAMWLDQSHSDEGDEGDEQKLPVFTGPVVEASGPKLLTSDVKLPSQKM